MSIIYSRPRLKMPQFVGYKRRDKQRSRKRASLILVVFIAFTTLKIVLDAVTPIFNTLCQNKAISMATLISNNKATEVMQKHTYDELFSIEKDENGSITLIKANVVPINEITSDIAVKIQEEINKQGRDKVEIALGSFTGLKLLSGRGPGIKITISTIGNVKTDLKSQFISKGINQTLHRVYLQVECEVSVLTPFDNITQKIENQILVSEHVIVGHIPNTYYNLEGMTQNEAVDVIE